MRIPIQLSKGEQIEVAIDIDCRVGEAVDVSHLEGNVLNLIEKRGAEISGVDIYTSNEQFNDWIGRSVADLKMLVTSTSQGLYPYAGVPWFSTIFGRDELLRVWNICGCVLRLPKGF